MRKIEQPSHISRRSLLSGLSSLILVAPAAKLFGRGVGKGPKFDSRYELVIDFEIATQPGFRVKRPYVAIWIEDKEGKAVRTLTLWVHTQRKGPRYIPDLRRWYRDEQARIQADGGDLVTTIASPTREAGSYSVVWDGKNDKGNVVDQGEYTVYIESAREHGTYQLMKEKLSIGTKPSKTKLDGNVEIKGATIELRKRK